MEEGEGNGQERKGIARGERGNECHGSGGC